MFSKYALYGLPLLPGVFASTLSLGADKYLVSYYLGLKKFEMLYVSASPQSRRWCFFFQTSQINDVLFPELSALHDKQESQAFCHRFAGIQKFVFGFGVGATALLSVFPGQILRILASRNSTSGAATLAILGVQGIFMAFVLLYVVVLNVQLRVWSSTLFWALSGVAIVALDVLLLPRIGIIGAAISQLIATACGAA